MTTVETKTPIYLAHKAPAALAVAPESTSDGKPMRRFRKELIRTGTFRKPKDGLEFAVTRGTLDHWALTFSQMRDAGRRVPVPIGHLNPGDPRNNCGWIHDMFVEDDRLVGIVDLYGDEGLKLAATSDVSIYAEPEFDEPAGGTYKWPILHVALCTDPVVPGLGEFTIAASQGKPAATIPILTLSMEAPMPDPNVPAAPATPATPSGPSPAEAIKESFKKAIIAAIDDPGLDMMATLAAIKKILKDQEKVMGIIDPKAPTADATPADAGQAVAASLSTSPGPVILGIVRENRTLRLDKLAVAGKLTPPQRKSIEAQCLTDEAIALSLSSKSDPFASMCALLEAGPSITGERTGAQVLSLSLRDDPNALSDTDKKVREDMKKNACRQAGMKV
jgi:hypothetical protein